MRISKTFILSLIALLPVNALAESNSKSLNSALHMAELSVRTIYLMGFSFILGSLFTVLLLLVLDFMRSSKQPKTD